MAEEQNRHKNIQWYPGHMTKAKRAMQEDIKLVDLVIEVLDARAPLASRNPDINSLAANKLRMLILNKADLADDAMTKLWKERFVKEGCYVVIMDARNRSNAVKVREQIDLVCREKKERDRKRGILNRPVRAMVVGIPNVGKSTFINSFSGKASAKTGNKPGVTKGNQWIRLNKDVELLDTPGILWPKFEDYSVGMKLAFLGTINDEIVDSAELAAEILDFLLKDYRANVMERYGLDSIREETELRAYHTIENIAMVRKCLTKGGEPDVDKAAKMIVDDFRNARFGKITLDVCSTE